VVMARAAVTCDSSGPICPPPPPDPPPPDPTPPDPTPDPNADFDPPQDKGVGEDCFLKARDGALVGIVGAGVAITGTCVGALVVTGPGTLTCLAPAAGTAVAAVVGALVGGASYAICRSNSDGSKKVIAISPTNTCTVGSYRFCRNLYDRYKAACGPDTFSNSGQISCRNLSFKNPQASSSECIDIENRIALGAQCLKGRIMMRDFISQGLCFGSQNDPDGTAHEPPIQAANDHLAYCKSMLVQHCADNDQGVADQAMASLTSLVYRCE